MTDIESWLKFYHIVFPMMIISFAWTSSYWIKDWVSRFCVFVIFVSIYQTILNKWLFLHLDYESLNFSDEILEFIVLSIVKMEFISFRYMNVIAFIAVIILFIRYKLLFKAGKK